MKTITKGALLAVGLESHCNFKSPKSLRTTSYCLSNQGMFVSDKVCAQRHASAIRLFTVKSGCSMGMRLKDGNRPGHAQGSASLNMRWPAPVTMLEIAQAKKLKMARNTRNQIGLIEAATRSR